MEEFIRQLTELFHREFPNSEVELEPASAERVGGLMTWEGFVGREQLDRQRQLWRVIRANLPAEQQLKVSAILTMTPEEIAAARQS